MSSVFYRKGIAHTINGFDCDILVIEANLFNGKLPKGWFFSPEEAHGLQKETNEENEKENETKENGEEDTEENVLLNLDTMSNRQIRELAKEKSLDNWDDARISTLKRKLKA